MAEPTQTLTYNLADLDAARRDERAKIVLYIQSRVAVSLKDMKDERERFDENIARLAAEQESPFASEEEHRQAVQKIENTEQMVDMFAGVLLGMAEEIAKGGA